MEPQYVHVSLGQFEATAIQKLIARGIREDVARAFVTEGLRKQNGYDRYKEIVCKAKFHSFFVHKPDEGVMVPTVLERKTNKFKAPFSMTGREKAELMSSFPELDVSCDGTIRNSHAFYANKRLAECELLISLVWASAVADGTLDPRSVVDVGGNQTQHINRGRGHVHCDTPVLSAKDIYRYTVREVYSGVDPSSVCNKSFHSCSYKADFGIGVHSTYDLSPQSIAEGMCHRKMKVFFGVVNIHPGLSHLTSGEYIHDGMVLRVSSNEVSYGFVHDTSLVYTHSKAVMSSYLHSSLSLPVKTPQGTKWYLFKHHSVRGATIVFSVTEVDTPSAIGTAISTGARANKYRIIMDKTDIPFDVDVEMFDRLVLMAAASRKIDEYNITALFKYAKSLRQRISINSIVLSSGFREDTSILVKMTVAAMAVASAYHYESARFFQSQTRNMMRRRNKSLMFQVFDISTGFVSLAVDTVSSIIGLDSAFNSLQEWANNLLKAGNSVRIEVATIKDFGCRFDGNVLGPVHAQLGKPNDAEWFTGIAVDYPDDQLNWSTLFYVTLTGSKILGHEHYNPSCLAGYGYRATYPPELVVSRCKSTVKRLFGISSMRLQATATRDVLYKAYLNQCPVKGETSGKIRHLDNGDSVVHVMTQDPDDPSVPIQHCFIAFRGVGSKYILCERPSYYSSRCIAFVLFFEEDITEMAHLTACGQFNAETLPNPLYSVLKHCASHLQYLGQTEGIAFNDAVTGKTAFNIITKRNLQTGSHVGGVGTRPEIIENTPVLRNTQWAQMEAVSRQVFDNPEAYMSTDEDSDDDGVLGVEAEAMANNSVGSGDSDDISRVAFSAPEKGMRSGRSHADRSVKSAPAGVMSGHAVSGGSEHSVDTTVLPGVGSPSGESSGTADEAVERTTTTDHFYSLLKNSKGKEPARRNWGSDSTSSVSVAPGFNAIAELLRWAEESSTHALSVGRRCVDFAISAIKQDLSAREWHGIQSGLEGDVQICELDSAGVLVEYYTKERLTHMAVTDGEDIYVVGSLPPGSGPFVTYRDLEIWTVSSIISVASRCMFSEYQCPVELIQGPAGCGKTTEICNKISDSDFGMCETKAAAKDTADRLRRAGRSVAETFCTVDSFLINKAQNFSAEVDTLFIDECLRLHAGKIWCLIKIMKPRKVVCYGDPKQIPLLPFTPDFEFSHSVFPWSSVSTLKRTFRLPGDITMMLVESGYYDYKFKTHNKVVHGFKGVKQFYPGIFKDKPEGVVVLTYTKAAADDLRIEGIAPVMTIGESQGKDLDDVWLYRESDLAKDIYYNREQTLTAITRVKRSFSFIPVSPFDDSEIQSLIKLLDDPIVSATVASYMESG